MDTTAGAATRPLRILHLEDDANDAELVRATLDELDVPLEVVDVTTRARFEEELAAGGLDIILSDYALPGFDGLAALALARKSRPDVPFILVSGTIGEEAAIESLVNGATDYVLKHRLSRLAPAVRRALDEAAEKATRRAAEEALEHEQRFLRAVLDSLETAVIACAADGAPVVYNRPVRRLYGLPSAATPPAEWAEHYRILSADGAAPLAAGDAPLARALRGEHLRDEELVIEATRGGRRNVLVSAQPIRDVQGTKIGAVVAMQDVTERRNLERQFHHVQKMEALGHLAAGVAHDFNNLITVISGHTALLKRRIGPDDGNHRGLAAIDTASQQAARLTRQLLAFGRRQVLQPKVMDLNTVLSDTRRMLERIIGADVTLTFLLASDLDRVTVDAGQVEQILMNLIVNARDAMPDGGSLTIRTSNVQVNADLGAGEAGAHAPGTAPGQGVTYLPKGRYVRLTVTDTGTGMDGETMNRVFEPFFTTKGPGKGTGLGLSTVHGIVTQSGGHIAVRSEPGRGTSFIIHLPATEDAETPSGTRLRGPEHLVGRETVLVVDDDEAVRKLVGEILRDFGYTVAEAESAEDAFALIEHGKLPADALVTDVMMPRASGTQLAKRLAAVRPNLPTLYISGNTGPGSKLTVGQLGPGEGFLAKPFSPEDLAAKLREVIAGARSREEGAAAE